MVDSSEDAFARRHGINVSLVNGSHVIEGDVQADTFAMELIFPWRQGHCSIFRCVDGSERSDKMSRRREVVKKLTTAELDG